MKSILFKNVTLNNQNCHILVVDGLIKEISKAVLKADQVVECQSGLVLPPFNDPHVHIDSAFSAGVPRFNESGSLFEGIEIWKETQQTLTEDVFIKRTNKLFNLYVKNGVQNIRAHVDVSGKNLNVLKWAIKQKKVWADKLNIQLVAFPQNGLLTYPHTLTNYKEAITLGVDVLGGIPHYELSAQLGYKSIDLILELAKKHQLLVDIHCDEIDDGNSRFLEYLSAQTFHYDLINYVTASHTTAFAYYNQAYVQKLWRSFKLSKINFIANPLINVHLGGRFENINPGRGITQVKKMLENKINVAYGHDDIEDPWYPMGTANMMQVLFMGIHLNHLLGKTQIIKSIDLITNNSAKLMHLKNYGITKNMPANFIIFEEKTIFDTIKKIGKIRLNIRQGKIIN